MRHTSLALVAAVLGLSMALGGCLPFQTPQRPDNRIRLIETPNGLVALPPECPSWREESWGDPWENSAWPGYGCAQARNLAAQVEDPADLIGGRPIGSSDGITSSATISRYQSGQTTPLLDPGSDAPKKIEKMEDARIGGAPKK